MSEGRNQTDRSFTLRELMAYTTALAVVLAALVGFKFVPMTVPNWVEVVILMPILFVLLASLSALLGMGVALLVGGRKRMVVGGIVAGILFLILLLAVLLAPALIAINASSR
jgi:hypothetical protein